MTLLPAESREFRELLISKLWDDDSFGYVDEDCFLGTYPICGRAIGVRFHGRAPRVTLTCHGCTEAELAARIGLEVRP